MLKWELWVDLLPCPFVWFLGYPWYPQGSSSTPNFKSLNTVNVYLEVNINGIKNVPEEKGIFPHA